MWTGIACSLLVASTLAAGVPGELSVTASRERADYGVDDETVIRAYTLRWIHGNETQWRVELPWLYSDSPDVRLTTAGPVPGSGNGPGPGSGEGNGPGPGSGDGNGSGPGNGENGSPTGSLLAATTDPDSLREPG